MVLAHLTPFVSISIHLTPFVTVLIHLMSSFCVLDHLTPSLSVLDHLKPSVRKLSDIVLSNIQLYSPGDVISDETEFTSLYSYVHCAIIGNTEIMV